MDQKHCGYAFLGRSDFIERIHARLAECDQDRPIPATFLNTEFMYLRRQAISDAQSGTASHKKHYRLKRHLNESSIPPFQIELDRSDIVLDKSKRFVRISARVADTIAEIIAQRPYATITTLSSSPLQLFHPDATLDDFIRAEQQRLHAQGIDTSEWGDGVLREKRQTRQARGGR